MSTSGATWTVGDVRGLGTPQLLSELANRGLDLTGNDGALRGRLMEALGLQPSAKGSARRTSKNKKRRTQRKSAKSALDASPVVPPEVPRLAQPKEVATNASQPDVKIVYRSALTADDVKGTEFAELADVISKFGTAEALAGGEMAPAAGNALSSASTKRSEAAGDEEGDDSDDKEWELDELGNPMAEQDKLSNRKRRLASRLTLAELKSRAAHPEVVEVHDAASHDATLLVHLKAQLHSVPVPAHWSQKRKYLMGKRALEKTTFQLPKFIRDTGIADLRDRALEEDAQKSLKQRMRDKVRPKLGRVAVDYEILHDAFFKHQTKPPLSAHGELYYEGKDSEHDFSHCKPGVISAKLREALSLPPGAPPPWLLQMQRYGPPPSYSNLRVPGLNAPIPEGASYGHHAGGWGMPPVDIHGRPLYGDPFGRPGGQAAAEEGVASAEARAAVLLGAPEGLQRRWGEADSDEEGEEERGLAGGALRALEEDEEPAEGLPAAVPASAPRAPADGSGVASVVPGTDTPAALQLRKQPGLRTGGSAPGGLETPSSVAAAPAAPARPLYQVLQEAKAEDAGGIMDGGAHRYVMPSEQEAGAQAAAAAGLAKSTRLAKRGRPAGAAAAVAVDLEELEGLDPEEVERRLLRSRAGVSGEEQRAEIDAMLKQHQRDTAAKRLKQDKKDNQFF